MSERKRYIHTHTNERIIRLQQTCPKREKEEQRGNCVWIALAVIFVKDKEI